MQQCDNCTSTTRSLWKERKRILQISASQHSRSLVPIMAIMSKVSRNLDSLLRSGKPGCDQLVLLLMHLSCITKSGQAATALPGCPAHAVTRAILTTWYRCSCVQKVAALQAVGVYGVSTDITKHIQIGQGRADSSSPVEPEVRLCFCTQVTPGRIV